MVMIIRMLITITYTTNTNNTNNTKHSNNDALGAPVAGRPQGGIEASPQEGVRGAHEPREKGIQFCSFFFYQNVSM